MGTTFKPACLRAQSMPNAQAGILPWLVNVSSMSKNTPSKFFAVSRVIVRIEAIISVSRKAGASGFRWSCSRCAELVASHGVKVMETIGEREGFRNTFVSATPSQPRGGNRRVGLAVWPVNSFGY